MFASLFLLLTASSSSCHGQCSPDTASSSPSCAALRKELEALETLLEATSRRREEVLVGLGEPPVAGGRRPPWEDWMVAEATWQRQDVMVGQVDVLRTVRNKADTQYEEVVVVALLVGGMQVVVMDRRGNVMMEFNPGHVATKLRVASGAHPYVVTQAAAAAEMAEIRVHGIVVSLGEQVLVSTMTTGLTIPSQQCAADSTTTCSPPKWTIHAFPSIAVFAAPRHHPVTFDLVSFEAKRLRWNLIFAHADGTLYFYDPAVATSMLAMVEPPTAAVVATSSSSPMSHALAVSSLARVVAQLVGTTRTIRFIYSSNRKSTHLPECELPLDAGKVQSMSFDRAARDARYLHVWTDKEHLVFDRRSKRDVGPDKSGTQKRFSIFGGGGRQVMVCEVVKRFTGVTSGAAMTDIIVSVNSNNNNNEAENGGGIILNAIDGFHPLSKRAVDVMHVDAVDESYTAAQHVVVYGKGGNGGVYRLLNPNTGLSNRGGGGGPSTFMSAIGMDMLSSRLPLIILVGVMLSFTAFNRTFGGRKRKSHGSGGGGGSSFMSLATGGSLDADIFSDTARTVRRGGGGNKRKMSPYGGMSRMGMPPLAGIDVMDPSHEFVRPDEYHHQHPSSQLRVDRAMAEAVELQQEQFFDDDDDDDDDETARIHQSFARELDE